MHAAETLPRPQTPEAKTPWHEKAKSYLDRLTTYTADLARDVQTANEKAREKFGEDAVTHAGRGGATTLIGVALDIGMEGTLTKALNEGVLFVGKQPFQLGRKVTEQLVKLGEENARVRYFIDSAVKNFLVGLTYNTMAHFSSDMLPKAQPKHLLGSIVASATEAMGPKGIESKVIAQKQAADLARKKEIALHSKQVALLENAIELQQKEVDIRNLSSIEKKTAFAASLDPAAVVKEARQKWLDNLNRNEAKYQKDWLNEFIDGKTRAELIESLPRPLSKHALRRERARIKKAALTEGEKAAVMRQDLLIKAINASVEAKMQNFLLKNLNTKLDATRLKNVAPPVVENIENAKNHWKAEVQNLIKYANPATLLGIDWMVDGVVTLGKNFGEVRKVRKEKGIVGKKVEMEKKQTYYGSSNWGDRNRGGRRS